MAQRRKLTIDEALARQPDLVPGQEWKGVTATYSYRCVKNPKHAHYEQQFYAHMRSKGCQICDVEKRIADGSYYRNHDDKPQIFRK